MKKYNIGYIGCGFSSHGAGTTNEIHFPSVSKIKDGKFWRL